MFSSSRGPIVWAAVIGACFLIIGIAGWYGIRADRKREAPSPRSAVAVDLCQPKGPGGFLQDDGGYIGIFIGDEECHALQELMPVAVDTLADEAQRALRVGVPFADDSDLPQILDGLLSGSG